MLMMDKEDVERAMAATKDRLGDPEAREECIADIQKLIQMKESHMWRADQGSCVGNLCNISSLVDMEIDILKKAIDAMTRGDGGGAAALLDEYVAFVDKHYDNERTPY